LPQQHPIATNDYSNGYQNQTMDSGGYRTGDYYYHQHQKNYHNHQLHQKQNNRVWVEYCHTIRTIAATACGTGCRHHFDAYTTASNPRRPQ